MGVTKTIVTNNYKNRQINIQTKAQIDIRLPDLVIEACLDLKMTKVHRRLKDDCDVIALFNILPPEIRQGVRPETTY